MPGPYAREAKFKALAKHHAHSRTLSAALQAIEAAAEEGLFSMMYKEALSDTDTDALLAMGFMVEKSKSNTVITWIS